MSRHDESDWVVPRVFEQRARETPAAIAVSCRGETLTYAELDARANRVATSLRDAGVGLESPVVLCVNRSIMRLVAVLGVLKAGAAYVAVERAWPVPYLRKVVTDVKPALILASTVVAHRFTGLPYEVMDAEVAADKWATVATTPVVPISPENLAYVTYTSGTTGSPKGIAVPHRGIIRLARARTRLEQTPSEVFMHFAPLSFDNSTFEIFVPLLTGARVEVVPEDASAEDLEEIAGQAGVSTVLLSTGLFHALADSAPGLFAGGRQVLAAGDVLSPAHARKALAAGAKCFVNAYGPAENTDFTTVHVVTASPPDDSPWPIGAALAHTSVYVLDADLRDVNDGIGELWTGGAGLARGYLHQPALTAERFRPDPFGETPGARMYGTRDLARRRDGVIEFHGRIDSQVKIRGFRVELDEVTAVLRRCPNVADVAIVVEGSTAQDRRLVGYIVPARADVEIATIAEWLQQHAPEHLVPSEIFAVTRFPLGTNGKVDRRALANMRRDAIASAPTVAPRDALEMALVQLCEEVLRSGPIGVRDDFFKRGGRSIQALAFVAGVQRRFGVKLPLSIMGEAPTIEALAQMLRRGGEIRERSLVLLRDGGERPPLFLFHPAGGSVLSYIGLCRLLPTDRRCYGLQSPEFGHAEQVQDVGVDDLARLYLEEMRSVWPDGPYMLAGWSMGGLLAFEAAQQLTRLGADVLFVGLIDAGPASDQAERIAAREDADLLLMQAHYVDPAILRELEQLPGEVRFERALDIARAHHVFPPDVTVEQLRGRIRLHRRNALAHARYRPQPFDGIVDLFRASSGIEAGESVDLGWHAAAGDRLRVHIVPGEHYSLPYPPSVTTLAARLATCLAEAEARVTPSDVAVS